MSTWSVMGTSIVNTAESPPSFLGSVFEEEFSGCLTKLGEALCDARLPLLVDFFPTSLAYDKGKQYTQSSESKLETGITQVTRKCLHKKVSKSFFFLLGLGGRGLETQNTKSSKH